MPATSPPVAVFGHRGSRRPGPENTVRAVRDALAGGADGVEVDVRRAGERLVLAHGPGLEGAEPLGPVLDAALGRRVICEVKNQPGQADFDAPDCATAGQLVDLLRARAGIGQVDDVVVSSFDWASLELVRALGGPPTAFLTPPGVALRAGAAYATEHGHAELHPHWSSLTARGVARVHGAGLRVVPWTAGSTWHALALARLRVDGVICDAPAEVVRAFSAHRRTAR